VGRHFRGQSMETGLGGGGTRIASYQQEGNELRELADENGVHGETREQWVEPHVLCAPEPGQCRLSIVAQWHVDRGGP
jgi:hypothetical protein